MSKLSERSVYLQLTHRIAVVGLITK